MAYRTFRQGAADVSGPEKRDDYEDYMATPEGRAKANLIALGIGGLGTLGAKAITAAPSLSAGTLRQWLSTVGARKMAPEAVLMEPAAGVAARDAIVRGSVMTPRTAGATMAAGIPIAMPFVPGASSTPAVKPEGFDNIPMPQGPERSPEQVLMDQVNREREAADAIPQREYQKLTPRRPARPAPEVAEVPKGLLQRIFSGEDYQSSNALASDPRLAGYNAKVVQGGNINWGDRDNAADFFRADAELMRRRKAAEQAASQTEGKAGGGAVAGKDAAIHKALEIIHHLLTRGH
jgi:hypothetical protein